MLLPESPLGQTSKYISSVSFVRIESNFLQYTGDTDAKNDGPQFWNSNSVIFENFLKFSKRGHAVPLRPIWTIMVATKLDHSRVLVTKCNQNRSTMKGRSAGQRHTDRQKTRLKIRALQVCNRANKQRRLHNLLCGGNNRGDFSVTRKYYVHTSREMSSLMLLTLAMTSLSAGDSMTSCL